MPTRRRRRCEVLPVGAPCRDDIFLRRAGSREELPPGWSTHPLGPVGGVPIEFVFRPDRHDVCRALNPMPAHAARGLAEAGYRRVAGFDGGGELWARERSAAVRARLAGFRVLEGGRARTR